MGGKTSTASKRKYNEKAYDRITISVRKDNQTAVRIQAAADRAGQSVTAYIVQAIENRMAKEQE